MSNTFEKFADSGYRLLEFAQEEALGLGYREIGPEHMLLGLLRGEEGRGAIIVRELDIDTTIFYKQVRDALILSNRLPVERTIGLSSRSKLIVKQVARLCGTSLGPVAGSEHFLLALLYKEDDLAREMLNKVGITIERVLEHLQMSDVRIEVVSEAAYELEEALKKRQLEQRARLRICIPVMWFCALVVLGLVLVYYSGPVTNFFGYSIASLMHVAPFLWVQPQPKWYPWFALLIGLTSYICWFLLCLPLYWVYGYWLPRHYRKEKKAEDHALWRWLRGHAIRQGILMISLLVSMEVIYGLFIRFPGSWWLWSAIYYGMFLWLRVSFMSMWIFPMFYKLTPITEGLVMERLAMLLERTKLRVDGMYMLEVKGWRPTKTFMVANAFLAYWGRKKRIFVTDFVITKFPLDEVEVILAHELGHLAHHDIPKRVMFQALFVGVFLFACQQFFFAGVDDPSIRLSYLLLVIKSNPIFALSIGCYLFFALYCLYQFLHRRGEYGADEYALQVTQKAKAFKNAMELLTHNNLLSESRAKRQLWTAAYPMLVSRLKHADEFTRRRRNIS
jgi:STE24 endopeptidase